MQRAAAVDSEEVVGTAVLRFGGVNSASGRWVCSLELLLLLLELLALRHHCR